MAHNKEELLKQYEKLPQAVREAMFAEASADKIEEIGRKHGLLLDKVGALADEVGYFMLGMTHPRDFKGQIARATGLSETKAGEIVDELNKTIFMPIRDHLARLHNAEESGVEMPEEPERPRPVSFAQGAAKPGIVPPMIFPQGAAPVPEPPAEQAQKIPPAPEFIKTFAANAPPRAQENKIEVTAAESAERAPSAQNGERPQAPAQQTTQVPPPKPAPQQVFKPNDPYHEQI